MLGLLFCGVVGPGGGFGVVDPGLVLSGEVVPGVVVLPGVVVPGALGVPGLL